MKLSIQTVALLIFAISLLASIGTASHIQAHFRIVDSVNDCEIRYEDKTQYDAARSPCESKWESLKGSDNCVNLAPDTSDTSDTSTDLVFKDMNKPGASWVGLYTWWPVAKDTIKFNEHWMNQYTSSCRKAFVGIHESGHAQRLAHSYSHNIMEDTVQTRCSLGDHDKADYREK